MANILLLDDEANVREILALSLNSLGHEVVTVATPQAAYQAMKQQHFDIIITDLRMEGEDQGLEVVRQSKVLQPDAAVLLLTAYASAETAVEAMRDGAFDYITKPVSRTELGEIVERALTATTRNTSQPTTTQTEQTAPETHSTLVGKSHVMQRVRERIIRAAKRDFTVLITGESGTGKELAARMLHEHSPRKHATFVPVHCGAIPENLFESELFGYVKGAFTGADQDKTGLIESANGGTLFLDEIGEMPLHVQVKLLRVLQDMRIRRVGSEHEIQVDVRIVAATNRDLEAEVKAGNFREDLFYRLNVIPIHMPSLRQRREDIPMLVQALMQRFGGSHVHISEACMQKIAALPLAGNVRELENTLQRLLALSDDDALDIKLLDELVAPAPSHALSLADMQAKGLSLDAQLERIEQSLIEEALAQTGGNATQAAKLLGISFRSMRYRMEKLGLKEGK